ncbi:hypothetical protein ACHAXS_004458 [Conticribra weissflogii]
MSIQKQRRRRPPRSRDYLDDANDDDFLYHGREYLKGFGDFSPRPQRDEAKNAAIGFPLEPSFDHNTLIKITQIGDPQTSSPLDPLHLLVTVVFPAVLLLGIGVSALGFLTRRIWFSPRELPSKYSTTENLTTKTNREVDIAASTSNANAVDCDDQLLRVVSKKCNTGDTKDHATDRDAQNNLKHSFSSIEKVNIDDEYCDEPNYELPRKKLIFADHDSDGETGKREVHSTTIPEYDKSSQIPKRNESNSPDLVDEVNDIAGESHNKKSSPNNYDDVIQPSENHQSHFFTPQKLCKAIKPPNSIYKTPAEYDLNAVLSPYKSKMQSRFGTMEGSHSNDIVSNESTLQSCQLSTPSTSQEISPITFHRESVVSYFQSRGLSGEKSLEMAAKLEIELFIVDRLISFLCRVFCHFTAQSSVQHQAIYEQRERHHEQQMKKIPMEKLTQMRKEFSYVLLNPTRFSNCIYLSLLGLGLSLFGRVWDKTIKGTLWNVFGVFLSRLCPECNAQTACTESSWTSYFMVKFDWSSYPYQYIQTSPYYCYFGCLMRILLCAIVLILTSRFINKVAGCVPSCAMVSVIARPWNEMNMIGAGVILSNITVFLCMNTHRYFVDPSREWQSSSSNTSRTAKELTIEELHRKVEWYESAARIYQFMSYFMSFCIGISTGWRLYWTV